MQLKPGVFLIIWLKWIRRSRRIIFNSITKHSILRGKWSLNESIIWNLFFATSSFYPQGNWNWATSEKPTAAESIWMHRKSVNLYLSTVNWCWRSENDAILEQRLCISIIIQLKSQQHSIMLWRTIHAVVLSSELPFVIVKGVIRVISINFVYRTLEITGTPA